MAVPKQVTAGKRYAGRTPAGKRKLIDELNIAKLNRQMAFVPMNSPAAIKNHNRAVDKLANQEALLVKMGVLKKKNPRHFKLCEKF